MPAGGFKTFTAGEILTAADTNSFLMQGMLVFADATARNAAITSPVEGQFAFLKDSDGVFFYDGSAWVEFTTQGPVDVDFLTIGGGGSGGAAGGGGAGGYRTSTGTSGGASSAEPILNLETGVNYLVVVGAGGGVSGEGGGRGHATVFGPIAAIGGGYGGFGVGDYGGSGGGGGAGSEAGGAAVIQQGRAGGSGFGTSGAPGNGGGGGGGANSTGANATSGVGGAGGAGLANSITGSSVTRAGGGGGGGSSSGGAGGAGGGTAGTSSGATTTPAANLGAGSGGIYNSLAEIRPGGSGVVIIKFPDSYTLTVGAGLTSSTVTAGGFRVVTFTAGRDFVSFN
jgi:hypothetical protein